MQLHRIIQRRLQILQVREVAVDQIVDLPLPLINFEIQNYIGPVVVLVVLRCQLHLEPPLQPLQFGQVIQIHPKYRLSQFLQIIRNLLA
jgi:hypothetical protein